MKHMKYIFLLFFVMVIPLISWQIMFKDETNENFDKIEYVFDKTKWKNTIPEIQDQIENLETETNVDKPCRFNVMWGKNSTGEYDFYENVIIYFHGFESNHNEIKPVLNLLIEDKILNLNIVCMRFPGSGEISGKTYKGEDFLMHIMFSMCFAKEVMKAKNFILMGSSTGGSYIFWTAKNLCKKFHISNLILISPNIKPTGWVNYLNTNFGRCIARLFYKNTYTIRLNGEEIIIGVNSILNMLKICKWVQSFMKWEDETIPAIFVYAPNDSTVNPKKIENAFENYGTKKKTQKHLITCIVPNEYAHVPFGNFRGNKLDKSFASLLLQILQKKPTETRLVLRLRDVPQKENGIII